MARRIDDTTLETRIPSGVLPGGQGAAERLSLVIVYYRAQPDRVGEVGFLEGEQIVGRGGARADDGADRLRFYRQRPAVTLPTAPIDSEHVSRRQLVVRSSSSDGDRIEVENVGRCPMLVNGSIVARAEILPGDTIALANELVLLVTKRVVELPKVEGYPEDFTFGGADKFGIVGESASAWRLRSSIAFAASSEQHVLVLGESGVGKELTAHAVHGLSRRGARKMLSRNAATIPEGLIDAELFGHAKNYPNPGMGERDGLIGEADGSTLFLDEIGELPVRMQAHLLRVLDSKGEYQRLGEAQPRRADVRVVAATNRNADELKHDFVARLTLRVPIPPLAERREDVPLLARHLLEGMLRENERLTRFFSDGVPRIDFELVDALVRHDFKLHTRELARLLWIALSESAQNAGTIIALTPGVRAALAPEPRDDGAPGPKNIGKEQVEAALTRTSGNVTRAARELGLKNRFALYRLMKSLGMDAKDE